MDSAFRPSLRQQVAFHPAADGESAYVLDPLTGRQVDISEPAQFVALLDGTRTLAELSLKVDAGPPQRIESTVRNLMLLTLLDGAGAETRERIERLSNGSDTIEPTLLPGARFECQGSGECCQNYHLGPLTDDDIAHLEALDIAAHFPHAGAAPYHGERTDNGQTLRFLRTENDRCIFLLDDERCGIHAHFGAAAKPGLCRSYPIEQMNTIEGLKIYDKGSCASFATSARRGLPLVDDLPRLLPVLRLDQLLYHPIVHLDPVTVCDYGYFTPLARALATLTERADCNSAEVMRAIGRASRDFSHALATCPLAPGEPDATVAAQCAAICAAPPSLFAPTSEVAQVATTTAHAAGQLADLLGAILLEVTGMISARHRASQNPLTARLKREVAQLVHLVQSVAAHAHDPSQPLTAFYAEVAARPLSPDCDAVLRLSIRQQLFGFHALVKEWLPLGMLRIGLIQLLAIYGGKLRATVEARPEVAAEDLDFGHMLAIRTLDISTVKSTLLAALAGSYAILEALPALAAWHTEESS